MTLPLDRIDVAMLAEGLDDASWDHEYYLDPLTGEQYSGISGEVFGADGEVVDPDDYGWVAVDNPDSSRLAYRDMTEFAAALSDRRLAERIARALDGKGAFRRFRDVVLGDADEAVGRAWIAFSDLRSELRALE